jgi:putative endopeptidase
MPVMGAARSQPRVARSRDRLRPAPSLRYARSVTHASRRRTLQLTGASLALLAAACTPQSPTAPALTPTARPAASASATPPAAAADLRFDVGAIDPKVDPCVDFYDYACGGWRASHPIPPDQSRWSRYSELIALNLEHERGIVEDAAHGGANAAAPPSAAETRIGAYHAACMDEAGIEARGLAPVREVLASIEAIRSARAAQDVIADLHAHGIDAVFAPYGTSDPHDAKKRLLGLDKGILGLRDPAAYAKTDDASVALRAKYVEYLGRLFHLLGQADGDAKAAASRTLAFETALAEKALTAVERRQAENQDHPMTVRELGARFPAIDWPAYFARLGAPSVDRVNVAQPKWLDAVSTALQAKDLAGVRDHLRMLVARAASTVLPGAIEAEVFDFTQRTLRGAADMGPRWKRCLRLVDRDLGDDVGRVFLARYFSDEARARMKTMVGALLAAYRADLRSSDWLGAPARAAAEAKLDKMLVVIGASNRPHSYEGLRVERDDPYGNAWRAQALDIARILAGLGKPVDREEFFDTLPQALDGFGSKSMNATGFTAGFLQPPVFDARVDDAVNFGGLGSVVGHELTHQLDDEGRKLDAEGNLRSWWSPEDVARFEERAKCFVDEYSRFKLDDGTPIDGKLTLGENIADNGGIRLSYAALHPSESAPKLDGFTPAQRFFLAWGQIRCENVTPQAARRQVESDQHAPGRWRVDGVVSNMPDFAKAFSCPAGAPMAPAKRCSLW